MRWSSAASTACRRKTANWWRLVGQHLTMSSVAQKQDIYDPETVSRFAELVGTPRRLTALYLLTVADIRGTSPKVWNAWKAKLLEDLYHAAMRQLVRGGQLDVASELEERKHQAQTLLRLHAVPNGVEAALWQQLDTVCAMRPRKSPGTRACSTASSTPSSPWCARLSDDHEGIQVLIYTGTARSCSPAPAPSSAALQHRRRQGLHHPPRLRAGHLPRLRARAS